MNGTNDFVGVLGAWLEEGPTRAPERPMEIAVEHARSHPRRRDRFGFLRPDVMAPRRSGPLARPALVLTLVGLLVIGAVGAVLVGSLRDDQSVVPPGPTPSPTAPSPTPLPSPSGPATLAVTIRDDVGNETFVSVVDASGLLAGAEAAEPSEAFEGDEGLELVNETPATLVVSWVNCPTDTGNRLLIGVAAKSMTLERGACAGDAMAVVKAIRLTFSQPVAAGSVETAVVDRR